MNSSKNFNAHQSSTSPGRPSPLSRPQWPWSSHMNRYSPPISSVASGSNSGETALSSSSNTAPYSSPRRYGHIGTPGPGSVSHLNLQEETTNEWNFTAFEWTVKNVSALRDMLEGSTTADQDSFELLRESPIIGDGKYMVEVARVQPSPDEEAQPSSLALSITSLMLDLAHAEFEMPGSMMAAIKCINEDHGTKVEWVWESWERDFVFRQGSEVWHCTLPKLSTLLQHSSILNANAFVLCLQIHSPVGPFFPHQPAARYVPRELLDGLEASLDNHNTGDVKFICLERKPIGPSSPSDTVTTHSRLSNASTSTHHSTTGFSYRKRIIWAHRDILIGRSEYFATMLNSSFAEANTNSGGRQIYTIPVEQADFSTVYWLLKWIYGNWLIFNNYQDPKAATEGIVQNWNSQWPHSHPNEWEWKVHTERGFIDETPRQVREDDVSSVGSSASHRSERRLPVPSDKKGKHPFIPPGPIYHVVPTQNRSPSQRMPPSANRDMTPGTSGQGLLVDLKTSPINIDTKLGDTLAPKRSASSSQPSYPVSPRQTRQPLYSLHCPDPHPHPTQPPQAASALSIYQIAHRYALPALRGLAIEHIMNSLVPENSFPLLLASSLWEELTVLIEDYVVHHWDAVSNSEVFNQSCQEVAAGEWGPEGGKALVALFRRLQSPSFARI